MAEARQIKEKAHGKKKDHQYCWLGRLGAGYCSASCRWKTLRGLSQPPEEQFPQWTWRWWADHWYSRMISRFFWIHSAILQCEFASKLEVDMTLPSSSQTWVSSITKTSSRYYTSQAYISWRIPDKGNGRPEDGDGAGENRGANPFGMATPGGIVGGMLLTGMLSHSTFTWGPHSPGLCAKLENDWQCILVQS